MDLPVPDTSYKWNHTICGFCDWLLSRRVFSRFTRVALCVSTSFAFMVDNTLLCIHHILFTRSSTDGHWGCFHFGDVMNSAAANIHVRVFPWTVFSCLLDIHLGVERLGHMISLGLTIWGTARPFSRAAATFHIPTSTVRVPIPLYLPNVCYYVVFKNYKWIIDPL